MDHYEEVLKQVQEVKGIVSAAPFILNQVMLSSESNVTGAVIKGIDPDRVGKVTELAHNMKAGGLHDLKGESDSPGIILGVELAKNLGVSLNDAIQVISPLGTITPMGMMPKMKRFRVVGVFYSGMYEYDNTMAYVSIEGAQKFFGMGARVSGIEIKTNDIYQVKEIGKEMRKKLGFPFWTKDWMEMHRNLFSAMKLEKIMMFIILVLIILVAAFNIISTLIMVVMEKYKDIAILKSMGASSKGILKIFVIEGLVTGVVGTVLGTILGLVVVFNLSGIQGLLEKLLGLKILASDVY
jgi:lipoprotein-releasing system permease protein